MQRPSSAQQALISFAPEISQSLSHPIHRTQGEIQPVISCFLLEENNEAQVCQQGPNARGLLWAPSGTHGDASDICPGIRVTSVQEFRWLLWSTYLDASEDTEMHLSFQTGFLLITRLLGVVGVCKAIAISSGCDDPSGLQQDALQLAFGIT